jgi:hypothetical protein
MISREQLAILAELYDGYQHSLFPLSGKRAEAGLAFKELLASLHATHAADIPFDVFRRATIEQCRDYLRKNKPSF